MHSKFTGDRPSHPRLMFTGIWVGHLDAVSRAGAVCHGRKHFLCQNRKYRKHDMIIAGVPKPGPAWYAEAT